jgi:hypothetical protein
MPSISSDHYVPSIHHHYQVQYPRALKLQQRNPVGQMYNSRALHINQKLLTSSDCHYEWRESFPFVPTMRSRDARHLVSGMGYVSADNQF